ncbi:PepSY-associated TM helix domain-containing protein [Pseudomonas sp. SH1-B]
MSLRQSMAGLHTWGGLLPSWLLFVILFSGTVACFDKELERWMRPALHQPQTATLSAEQLRGWLNANVADELHAFWLRPPSERTPFWQLAWEVEGNERIERRAFAPHSLQPLPETQGGDFFFKLHYELHGGMPGRYLVGLAGMFMLVALISGVIIHRRIFKDFFTLRPAANGQRAWLDAHNLLGVTGLPFHLVLAYTGVVIFVASYMPAGVQVAYKSDIAHFFSEVMGGYHREELKRPAPAPVSLDLLSEQARAHWQGGELGWISVHHPEDASAVVEIRRADRSHIASPADTLTYDAGSGELLHEQRAPAGYKTYLWLAGLHMAQFGGALVRGLYLLLGLAGCAMLVAGSRVWLSKRMARGGAAIGLVRALNGAVFAGLPLASLALLWGNRLLPEQMAARASTEAWVFTVSWVLLAFWAVWQRHRPSLLRQQLILGALLAAGLPLLALTTMPQGNLLASLARGDWALAGIDLFLLFIGLSCAAWAWYLRASAPVREQQEPLGEVR